jgi:CD2 antigen cytoplasmic tail-binding protein 2
VDIDSMLNPELAAERRARQRHSQVLEGEEAKGVASDIKGFEVRYNVCPGSPLAFSPPCLLLVWLLVNAGCSPYRSLSSILMFKQDGVNFVDDGIRIEPFNLEREREEGYFDENGNFVEYARGNEIKVTKVLCVAPLISYEKLLFVTQSSVYCRMHGWIVWKLIQPLLQRYRTKGKRK